MNIYLALLLFSFIILLYWVITELFTFFFRLTGLPAEKARFQVISLLTGTGFTTRESEIILSSRLRRRLARITMLFGYVFNVTIVLCLYACAENPCLGRKSYPPSCRPDL